MSLREFTLEWLPTKAFTRRRAAVNLVEFDVLCCRRNAWLIGDYGGRSSSHGLWRRFRRHVVGINLITRFLVSFSSSCSVKSFVKAWSDLSSSAFPGSKNARTWRANRKQSSQMSDCQSDDAINWSLWCNLLIRAAEVPHSINLRAPQPWPFRQS
jgi:hypothetical protein